MAKTTSKSKSTATKKDDNVKVTHNIDRVNLYDFGYEKAGAVKGDPDVFATYLDRIVNGDLVEDNYQGFSEDEKKERLKEIKELEQKEKELETSNASIEAEIKEKEQSIDEHRENLLKIRETREQDHEKLKAESFSPFKFTINLIILVMLTGYLFFFYVSAAYKALYVDFEEIAENIAQGVGTGSIMPGPYELTEALQYNYLLFLVPFVFYAFGWAFHIFLDMKQKMKYLYLTLLILVTFTVDFLIALIIHGNIENAKELMGLSTEHWTQSSTFYIILFLGFLVYIVWSVLLDSLLREWDKKHITNNIKKIIKHLQGDIKKLESKLADIEPIRTKITDYREDVSTVMYGNLKRYIDQFSSGWISYLSPANMKDAKDKCQAVKKEFEDKNDIKSGTVKVVRKRK